MKTVVFVDELLLVNFAAAAALLLGAGLLCGRSCTGLRLCAGSAAAAVSTLVLLAPPWPAPLAVQYKIASSSGVLAEKWRRATAWPGCAALPGCADGMRR